MSTTEETTESRSRKPGRRAKPKYLDHLSAKLGKDVKSLTARPSIPDEYNPDTFGSLKENEFDDALHYYEWLQEYHSHFATKAGDKAKRLESMAPELRNDVSAAEKSTDATIAHLRKLAGEGHDIAGLLAKISTGVTV